MQKNENIRKNKELYGGDYMIKNAQSLMAKSKNLATYNITPNEILQNYITVLSSIAKILNSNFFIS